MWPYVQVVETCLNVVLQTSANIQLVRFKSWELWLNPIKKFKIQKNVQNIFSTYMKIMKELSHALKQLMFKNGLNLDAQIPYI
jgi:hypothetical protein